ncbi:MAG: ribonuclease J, partial [Alphaproteobacteria bacterium]|nr:ribonuclease J [Alphaproteobacteria bacterium]
YSGSEAKLKESLTELVSNYKKMVIVTTFASNLARVESLIDIGAKSGRRVVLAGRSLHRVVGAAKASGYLQNIPKFVDEKDISAYDRGSLFIIATGCQGEPMAAVTKIANGTHPRIKASPGDVVIFSSKIIPGNDKKIFRVFNDLTKLRVETVTEKDHFVHVSGHPGRKELRRLYKLLKPETVIPVHGEHIHMHEHAKLAKSIGIKNSVEVENGDVLSIAPNEPKKVGKVEAGELAVYGNYLLRPDSNVLRKRRLMRNDGVFFATIILSKNYKLHMNPIIQAPGFLDEEEDKELIMYIQEQISLAVHMMDIGSNKKAKVALDDIQKAVKSKVKSIINREIRKIPIIQVIAKIV